MLIHTSGHAVFVNQTVLSQNLLTVPDDALLDTEFSMTMVSGQVRYRSGEIVR